LIIWLQIFMKVWAGGEGTTTSSISKNILKHSRFCWYNLTGFWWKNLTEPNQVLWFELVGRFNSILNLKK
jgi:hypothetical protein